MKVGPSSVLTQLNVDKVQASIPPSKVTARTNGWYELNRIYRTLFFSEKQLVHYVE